MNKQAPVLTDQPVGVSVVRDARGLESFHDPACAAAIWDREVPSDVIAWLADLDPEMLPNGRVTLHVKAVRDAVTRF